MSVEETIRRGGVAAAMLQDSVLSDAFEDAKAQFIKQWLETTDVAKREVFWPQIHALEAVRESLNRTVSDGLIAAEGLKRSKS